MDRQERIFEFRYCAEYEEVADLIMRLDENGIDVIALLNAELAAVQTKTTA